MDYRQETEKLIHLRTKLKEMDINHPDFKSYKKRALELDKKLKEIDASVGRWYTPQGNYERKL